MSDDILYECPLHSPSDTLNIANCSIKVVDNCLKHTTKLKYPIKNGKHLKFDNTHVVFYDDNCVEFEEDYLNIKAPLCPISKLHKNTSLRTIWTVIHTIIVTITTLKHRTILVGRDKKIIQPKQLCDYLFNFVIDRDNIKHVILTHKYLIVENKSSRKSLRTILPKILLYFLCRPAKKIQESCQYPKCFLRKYTPFFTNFPIEKLHDALCGNQPTTFQHIIDVFINIE